MGHERYSLGTVTGTPMLSLYSELIERPMTPLYFSSNTVETSDSGLSQIRTQFNKPLYKGHNLRSQYIIPTIHFEPPKEENLSTKNK